MSASIIDGKKIAADIKEELKVRVADLKKAGKAPGLVVIQVGEDPASSVYVHDNVHTCTQLQISRSEEINLSCIPKTDSYYFNHASSPLLSITKAQ